MAQSEVEALLGKAVTYVAPEELGRPSIRYFAVAVGDNNPLYLDETFAAGTRWGGIVAPPTLICETNQYATGSYRDDGYVGHQWDTPAGYAGLRGGNEYTFYRPARPDDRMTVEWRVAEAYERPGSSGPLLCVVSDVAYRDAEGDMLASNRETMVYRRQGGDGGRPTAQERPRPDDASSGTPASEPLARLPELKKHVTLTMMVAYAGATWDFHRYHYDGDFAREAGLPGPVVDGQMLGAFLAQLVVDWAGPEAFLQRLSFRLASAVYPGDHLTCRGEVAGWDPTSRTATLRLGIRGPARREVTRSASAVVELPPNGRELL
ncbi:MAG: hypothetical protein GEU28_09540 [Dehalococcoidia bacterium]|nr:hypothetical protein [Dehalococcoidia bacterium]